MEHLPCQRPMQPSALALRNIYHRSALRHLTEWTDDKIKLRLTEGPRILSQQVQCPLLLLFVSNNDQHDKNRYRCRSLSRRNG